MTDIELEERLLSRVEVAKMLGISDTQMRSLEGRENFLTARRFGKRRVYLKSEVIEYMRSLEPDPETSGGAQ